MEDALKSTHENEAERPRAAQAEAEAGDNPSVRPVLPSETVRGDSAQSSPLEDYLASEIRDTLEWRDGAYDRPETDPAQRWHRCCLCGERRNENILFLDKQNHDWACVDSRTCRQGQQKEEALRFIAAKATEWAEAETPPERKATMRLLAEVARTALPPLEENIPCTSCGGPPELILLLPDRPVRCFNCVLIAAMKRACAICGKHVTEVITRALDQQGHPNTIGTCAQCFYKAAVAQRN